MPPASRRHLPISALLAAQLIGGLGSTLLATAPHNPWLLLSWRYLAAGLLVLWWIPAAWKLPTRIKTAALIDLASVITFVLALSTVSVTLATTVGAFSPLLALAANHLTRRATMPALAAAPIALSMLATFLIASQDGTFTIDPVGLTLVIVSILLNVVGITINSWYGAGESPMARSAATNLLGALLLTPVLIATYTGPTPEPFDWTLIATAMFIAATSGIIAKALYLYAAGTLPAPLLFASSSLALVVTAITGWLILGQTLTWLGIAGVAVGVISTILLAYTTTKIRVPSQDNRQAN